MKLFFGLISAALFLALAACSSATTGSTPEPAPPQGAADLVKLAKDDLAKAKGVQVSTVKFDSAQEAQFNDSSLGCPQPGMSYLQVISPGWSIQLSIGSDKYFYSGANGGVVKCDNKPVIAGGAAPPAGGTTLR